MASAVRSKVLKVLNKQKSGFVSIAIRPKSSNAPEKVLTSAFKDIQVNSYTANDFVWQNLDRWPDKTATVSIFIFSLFYFIYYGYFFRPRN